jgi:hypothetical protein
MRCPCTSRETDSKVNGGNPLFARLIDSGVLNALNQAMLELATDRPHLE